MAKQSSQKETVQRMNNYKEHLLSEDTLGRIHDALTSFLIHEDSSEGGFHSVRVSGMKFEVAMNIPADVFKEAVLFDLVANNHWSRDSKWAKPNCSQELLYRVLQHYDPIVKEEKPKAKKGSLKAQVDELKEMLADGTISKAQYDRKLDALMS